MTRLWLIAFSISYSATFVDLWR